MVSGRVQGVYYRASVVAEAERLELQGSVRNLPDGRVEVIAKGRAGALAELAAWLWQGPPAARVDAVHVEEWLGLVPAAFVVVS